VAIDCFLTQAWVPPPLTPFEGIEQLPPASTLSLQIGPSSSSSSATPRVYWQPVTAERRVSLNDAVHELGARLDDAVPAQLVADVPLGAFLSGGLDSASVVAAMRKGGGAVRSFSMGFAQASFDESSDAAHTARVLGSDHLADVVDLDLERSILAVAETNDDLLADASMLAVDRLCALTRQHVTVALSGDGADEILAGYSTYAATYASRAWRLVPKSMRAIVSSGAARLPVSVERYNVRDFALRFLRGAERGPGRDFASWRIYFDDDDRRRLLRPSFACDGQAIERYARAVNDAPADTLLKKLLFADLTHYLPGDMLVKVDRASMRHGLEVRVPFLDPRFVDFALSLPSHLLLSPAGTTKRVLREHVEKHVSKRIARGKKRGFNVPIAAAFRGPLVPLFLRAVSAEPFRSEGPVDVDVLLRFLEDHRSGRSDWGYPLYAALVLALWWQRWVAA
jgi:asparagine synthase (glutamine-hydrolysing)